MRGLGLTMMLLFISGCATLSAPEIPGETAANRYGAKEILGHIEWVEQKAEKRNCGINVLNTRRVGKEIDTIVEHWTITNCGVRTIYKVRIAPLFGGTYKYTVTVPNEAEKWTSN